MNLFDTHCHLDHAKFEGNLEAIFERARAAGVTRIASINCAHDVESAESALRIARAHPEWIVGTSGVHPHEASKLDDALLSAIETAAADPLCVAIGETGLDFHYDFSPREAQIEAFRRQISLARAQKKPLVVHTRSAGKETLEVLESEQARDVGGIIHCFTEDAQFAKRALDLNFVAAFSGLVTFKNSSQIQEAARLQPLDSLLVETDAPYLAPVPHRGQRNEPAYVADTARFVAALRGISLETLVEASTENALRIFGMSA